MQLNLLGPDQTAPEGFAYQPDLVSPGQEEELLKRLNELDFKEFEFHGYQGKRRIVSFGLHYDFAGGKLRPAAEMPEFLLPLRDLAAKFSRLAPTRFSHVLVTEYAPGAGIGWHRDRPVFGDVVGISLVSSCRFRFRRKIGGRWKRMAVMLDARSAYLLRGSARTDWEHSILPMDVLRYSITFRTLKHATDAGGIEQCAL